MYPRPADPYTFPVERGKVLELARAIGATHPAHFTQTRAVAPATYLMCASELWGPSWEHPQGSPLADLAVDSSHTLHLEEEYEFLAGPLRAGDMLEGRLELLEPVHKVGKRAGPMTILTTRTSFHDGAGVVVARSRQVVAHILSAGKGA